MARGGTRSRSRTASRQRAVFRICFFFLGECLLPPRRSSVFTRVRDFTGIGHLGAYLRWPPAQILARPWASSPRQPSASTPRPPRTRTAHRTLASSAEHSRKEEKVHRRSSTPRAPTARRVRGASSLDHLVRVVVPSSQSSVREDGAGGTTPPQAAVPDGPNPTVGTAGPIEDGHRHHHGCASRAPRRPRPRARGGGATIPRTPAAK